MVFYILSHINIVEYLQKPAAAISDSTTKKPVQPFNY
jgi:hypothetical protein